MYYMTALAGTLTPSLEEMMSFGPANYSTTRSRYFSAAIPTGLTINISLTGLEASLEWGLYIYLVDRGNLSSVPSVSTFSCITRYSAASVTLKFTQVALSQKQRQDILNNVAFILSLFPWKIQEQTYFGNSKRLLEDNSSEIIYTHVNDTEDFTEAVVSTELSKFSPNRRLLQYTGASI
eukprot:CAMPEP_0176410550 /NCGR_PEP_ID=MMETSP0127-20121128/3118_1 /TAXON_ID=938130 /ORGANISM="Platyophrya macrostoma, Strain WH" /LENGTH=178 /DNA_ID=CAMNT_0017790057 /DNA_START=82 /DNA_END=615 /DNA_ORIENTATION=+